MRLRGERDLLSAPHQVAATGARGPLLVLAGAVLWGTAGASQELLGGAVPPLVVGSLRTVLGGIALGLIALRGARGALGPSALAPGLRGPSILAGVCIAVYQLAFFVGVRSLGIAVGTILAIGSAPFFAGAVAAVLGQGRPSRAWLLNTSIAVLGLTLLVGTGRDAGASPDGVVAALAAGAAFGSFTVLSKRLLGSGLRRIEVVAVPFVIAGVLLLPALVVGLLRAADPGAIVRAPGVLVVVWLALGATAAGYVLFIEGLRGVTAVVGTTLVLAEPLTASLLGVLVFSERIGSIAAAGALLVAVALLRTAARPGIDPAR